MPECQSQLKQCGKCRAMKPRDCFSKDSSRKGGLESSCKSCKREHYRRYHSENAEKELARLRKYRSENREKCIAMTRNWASSNPDRVRLINKNHSHNRRARMRGGMSSAELRLWEQSQRKVCHWCGAKCSDNYQVDHRIALSKGGKHEPRNLVIACPPCNRSKSARCPVEFAQSRGRLL